jgi:hypothetical protein
MEGLFNEALLDWTLLHPDDNSYLCQDDATSWDNDGQGLDFDALLTIPETSGFFASDDLSWNLNPTTIAQPVSWTHRILVQIRTPSYLLLNHQLTSQRHQKWTQPYHPIAKKHAV